MKTESLSDKAYNLIKDRLMYAEKGSFLSIREYANELGMSYTPVREAFLRLNKEGFLELVPKVGFFTTEMDANAILQIFQVRECIEPFVFEKVFNLISDKHIQILEECINEQKCGLKSDDIHRYIEADERFHNTIIDIYNNQYLSKLYKSVREQYLICSNEVAETGGGNAVDEHIRLVEYIKKKDYDNSLLTLRAHIENAKQRVKDGYKRVMDY